MAQRSTFQAHDDGHPPARRLSSFTHLTQAFNRRRGPTTNATMPIRESSIPRKPLPPTARRPSSPHPSKVGLPRSSTMSNLPKVPIRQLPTSASSISLIPSRISTPNGTRSRPTGIIYDGAGMPPPEPPGLQESSAVGASARKRRWRLSQGPEMVMPQIDADGSLAIKTSSKNKTLPELPRIPSAPRTNITRLGKPITSKPWPLSDRSNGLEEADGLDPETLLFPNVARTSPVGKEYQDTQPLLASENRKIRRESQIVHRGLLKAVEPAASTPAGITATPLLSSTHARRKFRILSSDTLPGSDASSSLTARLKSSLKKTQRDSLLHGSTTSPTIDADVDSNVDPGIYEAQPTAYWTGRWISLNDAILNDVEGEVPLPSVDEEANLVTARKEADRAKRVFEALEACCKTSNAKRSLWQFRMQFAEKRKMPELALHAPLDMRVAASLQSSAKRVSAIHKATPTGHSKSKLRLSKSRKLGASSIGSTETGNSTLASENSETSLGTSRSGFIGRLMSMRRKSSWGGNSG